jgi:hypothetical protein
VLIYSYKCVLARANRVTTIIAVGTAFAFLYECLFIAAHTLAEPNKNSS